MVKESSLVICANVGALIVLFLASQFHVIFYASRTWPNMFAFMLSKCSRSYK